MSFFQISEAEQRKLIHIYQQFVLDRKSENIRQAIYDYMIMYTILHNSNEKGLDLNDLKQLIEKDFHLSDLPQIHIMKAVNKLVADKWVKLKQTKITLSEKYSDRLKRNDTDVQDLENKVKNELKKELEKSLPVEFHKNIPLLIDNIQNLLGNIFLKHGLEAAQIFVDKNSHDFSSLNQFDRFTKMYQDEIQKQIPEEYKELIETTLYQFFTHPSENVCKFLFSMGQSYVLTQILNLDPQLKKLQHDAMREKRVFLDTNIIINLIFGGTPKSESIRNLVRNTRSLGVNLIVNRKTLREFSSWLQNERREYRRFKLPSMNLEQALGDVNEDDDIFFTSYYHALKNNQTTDVENFSDKYTTPEFWLEKYSIQVEGVDKDLENKPEIQDLKDVVSRVSFYPKIESVAHHDAYLILRIRQLRQAFQGNQVGPSTWFLTTDKTLAKAEKEYFDDDQISSSVTTSTWFQIISNLLSPSGDIKDASIALTKIIGSHFNSHKRNLEDFLNFVDLLSAYSELSLEQCTKIVGNQYITEKLRTHNKLTSSGEQSDSVEYEKIVQEVQRIANESNEKLIENLKQTQNDQINNLKAEQEKQMNDLESKQVKHLDDFKEEQRKKFEEIQSNHLKEIEDVTAQATIKLKREKRKLYIILSIIVGGFVSAMLDILLFKTSLQVIDENDVPVLALNIGLILGLPKLIDMIYKIE